MSGISDYFVIGERHTLGEHLFTPEAIMEFARKYDAQRFHVDAELARNSVFGNLCASGWHTTAVWMRKSIEHREVLEAQWRAKGLEPPRYGPSPGIRNLRWTRPVFAGETIVFHTTHTGGRALASRPGWNILQVYADAETVDGKRVLEFDSSVLIGA